MVLGLMVAGRVSMYSVTEALASMISGGRSVLGGVGEGGFEEGEGCDVEEGIEVVEVEE